MEEDPSRGDEPKLLIQLGVEEGECDHFLELVDI